MTNSQANNSHFEYIKTTKELIDFIKNSAWTFNWRHGYTSSSDRDWLGDVNIIEATCPTSGNYPLVFTCVGERILSVSDYKLECNNVLYLEFHEGDLTVYWVKSTENTAQTTTYPQWR